MNVTIIAAFIVTNRDTCAEWINGEGACCPACLKYRGVRVRGHVTRTDGAVRYHQCPQCMGNFKSVERITPSKIPDITDKPKKKRQTGVKKRRD